MKWRKAAGRGERANVAVDVWERLAPFVEALAWAEGGAEAAVEPVAVPAVVMGAAGAAGAYRTRHQAT